MPSSIAIPLPFPMDAPSAPWHDMGTKVTGKKTAEEAIAAAGLAWDVVKVELFPRDYATGRVISTAIENTFGCMRTSDRAILGVVGAGYKPLQNRQAFAFMDDMVKNEDASFEIAGGMEGDRCVWVLARIPRDIVLQIGRRREEVHEYLLLANRHDGMGMSMVKFLPVREISSATLSQPLKGGAIGLRHTNTIDSRVRKSYEVLGMTRAFYKDFGELVAAMAGHRMRDDAVRSYLMECLVKSNGMDDEVKIPSAVETCMRLHEAGMGADIARGTLWGAYNAVVELVDHHMNYMNRETRLRNVWFEGMGNVLKVKALAIARRMVEA